MDAVQYIKKQPIWAFCLLSFCSFGLYTIYWFYKTWRFFKESYDWDIYPFWRAAFAVLFTHVLFEEINELAMEKGHPGIQSNAYATGYVILAILQRVLDRILPVPMVIFVLLIPPFLFMIPTVKQLNYIYEKARPNEYRPAFSPGEFLVVVFGGLLMVFVVIGGLDGNTF